MRELSLLKVSTKRLSAALIAAALVGGFGCGDDDSGAAEPTNGGEKDAGPKPEEQAGSGGAPAIVPLPDMTAGKECTTDKSCDTGMCLIIFEGSFGGGQMEAPGGYCSTACMVDTDCGQGGICSGAFAGIGGVGATPGRCLKGCKSNSECRDGYRCVNALGMAVVPDAGTQDPTGGLFGSSGCEPVPATNKLADGVVGAPCSDAADCGQGRCQKGGTMMMYPGGYCTGSCLENSDCGANGSCTLPLAGGAGTCYLSCALDSDCREGYRCRANGSLMQCVPGAPALSDDVAGSACESDEDCGGVAMSCKSSLGTSSAPGGYCSQTCIDNTDCGAIGACLGGFGAALAGIVGATGTCYEACSDASDCREGYVCGRPSDVIGAAQTVCFVAPPPPASEDAGVE